MPLKHTLLNFTTEILEKSATKHSFLSTHDASLRPSEHLPVRFGVYPLFVPIAIIVLRPVASRSRFSGSISIAKSATAILRHRWEWTLCTLRSRCQTASFRSTRLRRRGGYLVDNLVASEVDLKVESEPR